MHSVCQFLLSLAFVTSTSGWAASSTQRIVPLGDNAAALQSLAEKIGAEAHVITVTGEQIAIAVTAGAPGALHGTPLEGESGEVSLPFESLAFVYYTESPTRESTLRTTSKTTKLPFLRNVGDEEGSMSCPQLDTELARAEAIRWHARAGAITPTERIERDSSGHFRRVRGRGAGVEIAALALCLLADAPPVGFCGSKAESDPAVLRLEASDDRIIGLMQLKAQKTCAGRATMQAGITDMDIWSNLEAVITSPFMETAALDVLGPKVQPLVKAKYEIEWLPNLGHSLDRNDSGITPFWKGSLDIADEELTLRLRELDQPGQAVSADERSLRLSYDAITAVDYDEYRGNEPVVVLRWSDGELGSLRLVREPGAKSADRSRALRQLRRDVLVRASADSLLHGRAAVERRGIDSSDVASEAAQTDVVNVAPALGVETTKMYEHARITASGRSDRGTATLTQHALVLPTEVVPYVDIAAVQRSTTTVTLKLTSGRKIVVVLLRDEGSPNPDPERMKILRDDLEARMAEARPLR